jgi:hypothetical protein
MAGYVDDPAPTAEAIDADGWLRTGDIGSLDEDGYLRLTDRAKDMWIVGTAPTRPADLPAPSPVRSSPPRSWAPQATTRPERASRRRRLEIRTDGR